MAELCPDCDTGMMIALSPMHPARYFELACERHRKLAAESSPYFASLASEPADVVEVVTGDGDVVRRITREKG